MHNEDESSFTEIIVPPVGEPVSEPFFQKKAGPFTTADLIAIFKLQRAGFVPSDFDA